MSIAYNCTTTPYTRTFKLGKLYYKFIKGTPLEAQGWTSKHVAKLLEAQGFIKLVNLQDRSSNGKFGPGKPHYIELEGKSLGRVQFFRLFKKALRAYADSEGLK